MYFSDTYPANADTECLEALRRGIPVLTCSGKAPASRLTGSFLTALGLPELISSNLDDYREMAIQLALNTERLAVIRAYLKTRRLAAGLFDASGWVRQLEARYERIWLREKGATGKT